jgi:NAD(P)-dependent dehydrogenase (short-subunit alcohol dehydrogenase family)
VDHPLEEWDRIVGINLMGVVHGCHFFVPRMIERGEGGHVVNISSMAGFTAVGNMTSYNATKFAVRGFSESLHGELAVHGIGVTAICPGIINTPIVRNMAVYGADPEEARNQASQAFTRRNYTPERLAKGILSAIQKDRLVAPITIESRLFWKLTRWTPGLVHWLNRRASKRVAEETAKASSH